MAKKQKPKKEKQLNLGLKESPKNFLYKIKSRTSKFFIRFEIKEFLKSPFTWFAIIISLGFIATQIYILINNISQYPEKIPIWQNQILLERKIERKDLLYIFPVISSSILLIGSITSNIFYHKEKYLSKILLFSVLLAITGTTFAFLKLVS